MTITLRQKDLENDNKSLYLDIYENGKRKFVPSASFIPRPFQRKVT